MLHLRVADNGCGIEGGEADAAANGHIGLANTRARLECLYGRQHSMELTSVPGSGVRVSMSFPFREGPAAEGAASGRA